MSDPQPVVAGVVAAAVCAPAAYLLAPWVFRTIPEPILDEGQTKPRYADLATPRAAAWCAGLAAVAGALIGWRLGFSAGLAGWLVLVVAGALLGYVDARTRYLPSAIIWPAYGGVVLALVAGAAIAGEWGALGRAAIAGAVGFGVFYVLWFVFPRGVGFGDVRLSGLLAIALGWLGWGELIAGLYGGFLLGAVLGIVLTLTGVFRRKEMFPFGPFMLAGAVAGAVLGGPLARAYLG